MVSLWPVAVSSLCAGCLCWMVCLLDGVPVVVDWLPWSVPSVVLCVGCAACGCGLVAVVCVGGMVCLWLLIGGRWDVLPVCEFVQWLVCGRGLVAVVSVGWSACSRWGCLPVAC